MADAVETPESRASRLASLRQEPFFHRERRKMVETDPDLRDADRARQLAYLDKLMQRLRQQLLDLKGH